MSARKELLEQQREQALRDIVDLERQVTDDEIAEDIAGTLRRQYEDAATRAIEALESLESQSSMEPEIVPRRPRVSRRSRARPAAYLFAVAAAVFAAVVVLPQYVAQRPDGGFVTGNEAIQPPTVTTPADPPQPPRDLSKVTEAEMEAAVDANPKVVGMRLALADRYLRKGQYDKASEHYGVALKQDPGNPEVQTQAGWLLFKIGNPGAALRFIDQALTIAPKSQDALWYKANILLYGRGDPDGALGILRNLAARGDLPDDRREQVNQLITTARKAGGK